MNISFGGASIRRPGAYSTVDTDKMVPITLGAFNVLAFVGVAPAPAGQEATALEPGKVYYFNNPTLARQAIGDSELLDCMNIAWKHGADLIAVSPVSVTAPETAPTDAEWQEAIDALDVEFVDGIIPVTSEPAIHAKVDTHVTNASSVTNRKERRAFYGHANGLTVQEITALQAALNTERGMMATPGVYVYDSTGAKVLKPSYYLASAYAGLWASQPPQEPLTYKYVKFDGLEVLYNGTQIIELLDGHIAPVEYVRNKGYRIVQGITLSSSADLTKQELSVSTLKDVMSKNLREYFEEKYVGKAGVAGIEVTMTNDLLTMIEKFVEAGWLRGYVPESVRVTRNGTAFYLEYEGQPTLPINNILITSHFTL